MLKVLHAWKVKAEWHNPTRDRQQLTPNVSSRLKRRRSALSYPPVPNESDHVARSVQTLHHDNIDCAPGGANINSFLLSDGYKARQPTVPILFHKANCLTALRADAGNRTRCTLDSASRNNIYTQSWIRIGSQPLVKRAWGVDQRRLQSMALSIIQVVAFSSTLHQA